ncbi:MAG: DUF4440 domain-containing protein [Gemmatimonadetes bacterium]|nr:DUF4440 domain-containing protein [Gemmatimonadota bacterium]
MSPDVNAAIAAANREFMEAFARQDAAGMAGMYTAEGQLLPANSDFVSGPSAIEQFWGGAMGMGIRTAKLETVELEAHGETAVEVGKYTLGGDEGQTLDQGKYVVVWKNDDGTWKLHRDIWTTSMPLG